MNVLHTQMHWLTLALTTIESYLFVAQLFHFLSNPRDRQRLWYLILLGLLILFNISNGFFPDPTFYLNFKFQVMLAYGTAYLMGAYFPFYFYKVYSLKNLHFHATWGVCLFLVIPYLVFDVILYALDGRLVPDRELGVIVPGLYGIIVLTAMLRGIVKKYRTDGHIRQYYCELMVWTAILPWEVMSVFAFYPVSQWIRIALGNLGWLVITFLQLNNGIKYTRWREQQLRELIVPITPREFVTYCEKYGLSDREIEIEELRLKGLSRQEIADILFISIHTVKTHISHINEKTGANNWSELFQKLKQLRNGKEK